MGIDADIGESHRSDVDTVLCRRAAAIPSGMPTMIATLSAAMVSSRVTGKAFDDDLGDRPGETDRLSLGHR